MQMSKIVTSLIQSSMNLKNNVHQDNKLFVNI